jgi:hypothetical protein
MFRRNGRGFARKGVGSGLVGEPLAIHPDIVRRIAAQNQEGADARLPLVRIRAPECQRR